MTSTVEQPAPRGREIDREKADRFPKHAAGMAVVADVLNDYAFTRGRLGLFKLVVKTVLLVPRLPAHRRWLAVVDRPTTRTVLKVAPRVAYRHFSAYLFSGLRWRRRIEILTSHYDFVNRHLNAASFVKALGDGLPLWCSADAANGIEIRLHGPPYHRGGDLELHCTRAGQLLFLLVFSVVPRAVFESDAGLASHAIYVGEVQGMAGRLDAIRDATRRCNDVAPPDLLMTALAGMAQAWGIDRVMCAGARRHLSAAKMAATRHPFDYAAFWSRYHAVDAADGHCAIDVPYPQTPILEIVNRHRKRTLDKRRFKAEVAEAVAGAVVRSAQA